MEMIRQALVECLDGVAQLRAQVLEGEGTDHAMTAGQIGSALENLEARINACVGGVTRAIELAGARSEGAAQARSEGFTAPAIAHGGTQAGSSPPQAGSSPPPESAAPAAPASEAQQPVQVG